MDKTLLEQWLCGAESIPPAPLTIAWALGLPVEELADTTVLRTVPRVRSLRFVLAVLQDLFPEDVDVQIWLEAPRSELRGSSARQALIGGQTAMVEALVVGAWNAQSEQPSDREFVHSSHARCCTMATSQP